VDVYIKKLLIVDNNPTIRLVLSTRLTLLDYKLFFATNFKEALILLEKEQLDLVILDTLLTKVDGYEVCFAIRQESQIPIIMLTSLGDVSNCVKGLELGADDCLIKPFFAKELEARIKSILRRSAVNTRVSKSTVRKFCIIKVGYLEIDLVKRKVFKKGIEIKLTKVEFNLLELLIENATIPLSRITILNNVWGYIPERYVDTRIVDVNIARLRSKLEVNSKNPDLIITVRGIGYVFYHH
jgi:OmpR family response regulator RpaB